ncbi:UDP-glucose 4-epimerase GalE [Arcobacter sp. FW59]|nr:UDP-glucose 4-epimerase GalE [Arcobacter sp. FW59]
MKILITGGAGYIGSHVAKQLLETTNYQITILDNLSTSSIKTIKTLQTIKTFDFIELDLKEFDKVKEILEKNRFDVIIHFAAFSIVSESMKNPFKYYFNNTVNTTNLIKCAVETDVKKFIFSSTAAVYGDIQQNSNIKEDFPTNPINPYGMSKLMSEKILQDTTKISKDFKYLIFRYFNVAGADMFYKKNVLIPRIGESHEPETHLIPLVVKTALGKREVLNIYGDDFDTFDGSCVRDYIHVEDLANAHIEAITYLEENESDIFNLGYAKGYSVKEIVNSIKNLTNCYFKTKIIEKREGDPAFLVADNNKILDKMKWKPKFDNLELICKSAYEWEKKYMSLEKNIFNEFRNYVNNFHSLNNVSIFGAGSYGVKVYELLNKKGFNIENFFDNNEKLWDTEIYGKKILNPSKISGDMPIVVASSWSKSIVKQLKENKNFNGKIYLSDPWGKFCDTLISDEDINQLEFFYNKLEDIDSKKVLINILKARMSIEEFINVEYEQYFHPIVNPKNNDIIIDGGAFIGDTIQAFNKNTNLKDLRIHSFEPDEKNFLLLKDESKNSRHSCFPIKLGLYDKDTTLKFLSTEQTVGYGCKIEQNGDVIIHTTSIDNYCNEHKIIPSYIKLDVEGVEKEVLIGAKNVIQKYKPKLAISLYHNYKDLWELPYLINQIYDKYKFYLGHHRDNWFETILYAYPVEK